MCAELTKEDVNAMRREIMEAMSRFIIRVLDGKETHPGEVEALPKVMEWFNAFLLY